jgi:ATP-binding cassette subfamily F protein 3
MTRVMKGKTPAAVRAQLGRFGFSGDRATTEVRKMSGGEKARLALALITRDAPHMLILDEPTNHLDVDAREALVQALNGYKGAVLLVSHDRHMVELTADRLVLVDSGRATEFDGSLEDYTAFILSKDGAAGKGAGAKGGKKADRQAAAEAREKAQGLRKQVAKAEAEMARLSAERSALDRAMFDPAGAEPRFAKLAMSDLMKKRADVAEALEEAEAEWMALTERLESVAA